MDEFYDAYDVENQAQAVLLTYLSSTTTDDFLGTLNSADTGGLTNLPFLDKESVSVMEGDEPRPQDYPSVRLYVHRGRENPNGGQLQGNKLHELRVALFYRTQILDTPSTIVDPLHRQASKFGRAIELALEKYLPGLTQIYNVTRTESEYSRPYEQTPSVLKLELTFEVSQRVYWAYGAAQVVSTAVRNQLTSDFTAVDKTIDIFRSYLNSDTSDDFIDRMNTADASGIQLPYVDAEVCEWGQDDQPPPSDYPALRAYLEDAGVEGSGGGRQWHISRLVVRSYVRTQAFVSRGGVITPTIYDALHKQGSKLARVAELALLKYLPTLEDVHIEFLDREVSRPYPNTGVVVVEQVYQVTQNTELAT